MFPLRVQHDHMLKYMSESLEGFLGYFFFKPMRIVKGSRHVVDLVSHAPVKPMMYFWLDL